MANNPINDNFTWLYNTLTERGVDLGSIEDTASAINSNADNRRWLYDEGVYQGLDMGSYEEFEEAMGFTKLQSSATLTPSEASEGAEQIAITQEPVAEKPIAPPTLLSRESEAPEMAEGDSFYSPNYVTTEAAEEAEQYELDKSALKSYVPEFKSEIKKKFPRARMSGFTKPVQLGGPGMSYVGEDAFLTIEDRQSISELDEKLKLGQIKKPEYEELIKVINQRAIDKYNEQYSEDTMNASAALHLMAKAQDRIKVVDSRTNSKIGNFFRGLKYADYAGINPELQLVDAYTSFALLNKLAENPDAELSESEEYLLQAIVTNNAVDDTFQTNMAERIGAGLPTNMAYMAQFALTGGVGGAAGAAAKKGTKWVIKQGMKNAERKLYAKGFKGLLQKGVDRTLNTVVPGVIGASVAATAQTALDPVGVSAEAMKRMAGTPTYAMEDGIPVATGEVANRKGAGEAWREAFATKWAENLSERSGESLGIALGAGKAVGKTAVESVEWMGNAVDKLSDFTKSIQSTKVGDIVTRAAMWLESKDLGFDKVAKAVGWNGTVEEFYEEQVNTVLNAWFVGDEDLSALFDSERQLETLLSVGVVGGAMRLVEAPVAIEQRAQIRSEKQNLKRTLTNIEKAHSSQADKEAQAAIASAVENGTISDVVSTLATLNRRGHWDESTAQDYLNYANARIMLNMWRSNDQRQASKITSEIYAETEARTHKQSGAIVVAEYTDASGNKQNVDIIDGVIIRDADKIDSALSDRSVIIRKQDGTTEMVSSKSLGNIVDEISPDVYRDNLHWATQQDLGAIFKTEYKSSMNRHGVHYYEDGTLDYYNAEPSQIALSLIDERGSIDEALAYAQQNANGIQQSAQVSAEGGERVTLEAQNMASKWGTVVELLGQMQAKAAATGGVVTPEVTADAEDAAAVGNNLRPGDRVRLTVDSGEVVDATIGARTPEGSVIVDFDEEVTVAGNKGQSLELTPEVVSAMTFVEEVQEGEEELEAEQNPEQDDVTTNADYALSRIPMGPNGRNWEAAKPLDVANAKVAEHNGDYEAAANFAQQMVDRITAEIDKLAASPLSVEDPTNADMVAAADNERAEQLASLAEKAAFWAEVVENINAAKAGFEASSGSASATSEATIEESVATDTTEAPAQPEGSMPMLEDGNPDFVSAGVERTAQFLADELGEDAAGFVQDNIAEAQKMLEDATAKKATSTNFAQRKQEATAIAEERAAAQARLDFWNAVAESYSAPQDTKAEEEGIPSYNREDEVAEETTGTTPEAEQTAPNEQSGAPAKEATSEMSDAAQERKAFYEQRLQEQGEISPRMPRGKYKLEDYLRGKDEPNPSLRHILYQDGFAVATDAFQLVADKEAYQSDKEGKWVDPQGNVVEPTTKLAWKKVVDSRADPKGAVATGISPEKALLFVGGLKAKLKEEWQRRKDAGEKVGSFEKFISDTAVMLPLPNGEVVAVNLSQLEKFARAAQHLGATDIMGRANDKPVFVQTDKGVALLMPVFLDYYNKALDYYAYTDLSVEQNTEESANFVESNAPTQEEVAPEAKSEESEGVTPERATEAEVTTEMIESSDLDETVKLGAIDYLNGNVNMATTLAYEIAKEYVRNNPQKRAADSTDAERAQLGEGTNDAGIVASEQSRGDGRELDTPEDGGAVSDGHGVRSEVSQNDMAEPSGSRGDTEMGERESSSDEVSSSGTDRGSRGDSTGEQGASVRNTRGRKRSGKGVSEQNEERRGTTRRANDSGDSDTRSVGEKKADDLIAEGLQELKDIFANPMGDAKGALLDATSIIGMFGVNAVKIMGASAKIGIGLIQKGYYKFQKWGAMMHQQLDDIFHNHTQLTDELIDEFINAMWDYPFKFRGEVRKISEWASLLEAEELRAMMRMGIEEKRKLQKNAEGEPTILGDIDNIRRSLPFLLPAQQEDVEKAEVQFFDESHRDAAYGYGKGYMFTNGTGTGKTYTGLGIIKRFIKQGKGRILIVTASGEKIDDWVRDAENLGITATRLEDTKSKGKGVVVTQFANLRQNLALLQDEFDLVVYDESHKLMENQSGIDTKAAGVHYMVTNRDAEQAILRTLQDHPYWVEPRGLEDEYKELNSLLNANRLTPEQLKRAQELGGREIMTQRLAQINARLKELIKLQEAEVQKRMQDPVIRAAADAAVARTKTVFLSATPFNTALNLDYAEGYIFSYPTQDGAARDREKDRERFLMDKFPSSHQRGKNGGVYRIPEGNIKDPDAVTAEEIAFSDYLQDSLHTMSGRGLDSEWDYSREFPKLNVPGARLVNEAISALRGKYAALRPFFKHLLEDYAQSTAFFEVIKTSASIERIKEHIALGRKVVVFHRRMSSQEPLEPPFEKGLYAANLDDSVPTEMIAEFRREFKELLAWEQSLDYRFPQEILLEAFATEEEKEAFMKEQEEYGDKMMRFALGMDKKKPKAPKLKSSRVGIFNGKETETEKHNAVKRFNKDGSECSLLVVQVAAGKEGISLHDKTGKHQRVMMSMQLPESPIEFVQAEGRIYRVGNQSNAIFEYPMLGIDQEVIGFAAKINGRAATTENLALGSRARGLRNSISRAVLASREIPVTQNQGVGGKQLDSRAEQDKTDYDEAIAEYNAMSAQRTTTDFNEQDTPEPIGFKMMEWARAEAGESVLEPAAGSGVMAQYAPQKSRLTAIESLTHKFAVLITKIGGSGRKLLNETFTAFDRHNKFDCVVMNSPHTGAPAIGANIAPQGVPQKEFEFLDKAFGHINEGGRIVALLTEKSADATIKAITAMGRNRVVVGEVKLPAFAFPNENGGTATRVVVFDVVSSQELRNTMPAKIEYDLSSQPNAQSLFEALRGLQMPERTIDKVAILGKKMQKFESKFKEFKNLIAKGKSYRTGKMEPEITFNPETAFAWVKTSHGGKYRIGVDGFYFNLSIRGEEIVKGNMGEIKRLCNTYLSIQKILDANSDAEFRRLTDNYYPETYDEIREFLKVCQDAIRTALGKTDSQIKNIAEGRVENELRGELTFKQMKDAFAGLSHGDVTLEDLSKKVFEAVGKIDGLRFYTKTGMNPREVAYYSPAENAIVINEDSWNSLRYPDGFKAQTVVHEMIHAVTSYYLRQYEMGVPLGAEIESACRDIMAVYEAITADDSFRNALRLNSKLGDNAEYGLTSATEMIAELANPIFRAQLKLKKLWRQLLEGIERLLGINLKGSAATETTALETLERALDTLMSNFNPEAYRQYTALARNSTYPMEFTDFSIRTSEPPVNTGIGYKVFVLKDGKLYPPMVANPNGEATPVGVWLDADAAPIAGQSKTGRTQVKAGGKGTQGGSGKLAYRPGWHLGEIPYALQFNRNNENGERALFPANFVWAEVEYADDVDYQEEAMSYGYNQKGKFQHSYAGLPRVPENGSYRYRTNPNPQTDPWVITGAMRVRRLLTPSEVDGMVKAAGREPQVRQKGAITDAEIIALNEGFGLIPITDYEMEEPGQNTNTAVNETTLGERSGADSGNSSSEGLLNGGNGHLSHNALARQQDSAKIRQNTVRTKQSLSRIIREGGITESLASPQQVVRVLGKGLKLRKSASSLSYYGDLYEGDFEVGNTHLRLRISTHPANGSKFGNADAEHKVSVVILKNGEHQDEGPHNGFEEYVYDPNRVSLEDAANAVLSSVAKLLETGEYSNESGLAEKKVYPTYNAGEVRYRTKAISEEQEIVERAKANGTYLLAPNGQPTNLTPKQWAQVRTKAFKEWFGDWEKAARIEKLRKSSPIVATGEEYVGKYELTNKSAADYINAELRGEYENADTGDVIKITRKGAFKVTRHDAESEAHLKSIALIPSMLENAIFITEEKNDKGKNAFDSYRYYVVGVNMGGVDYTVKLVIGVKNGETYYDHALTEIEKADLINRRDEISSSFTANEAANFEYKDRRLFEILQTNGSKVVDANGEPKVVWHGTQQGGFYEFNPSLGIGQSQSVRPVDNMSFFTDDQTIADGYALYKRSSIFEPYPEKPLAIESEQYDVVERHTPRRYNGFLKRWMPAKTDYGVKVNGQWIPNTFANSPEDAKAMFAERLKSIGYTEKSSVYEGFLNIRNPKIIKAEGKSWRNVEFPDLGENDGIIFLNIFDASIPERAGENGGISNVYVVPNAAQIKSATDNVGTFDANSPDIRHRTKSPMPIENKKRQIEEVFGGIWIEDSQEYAKFASSAKTFPNEENGEGVAFTDNYFYAYYRNINGEAIPFVSVFMNRDESQDVVNQVNQELKDVRTGERIKEYIDTAISRARRKQGPNNGYNGDNSSTSAGRGDGVLGSYLLRTGRYYDTPELYVKTSRADINGYEDIRHRKQTATESQQALAAQAETLPTEEVVAYANSLAEIAPEGVNIVVTDSIESGDTEHAGWYDMSTDTVYINADMCSNTADVDATYIHEIVGHRSMPSAIRRLIGTRNVADRNSLYAKLFSLLPEEYKTQVATKQVAGMDLGEAVDEVLAEAVENEGIIKPTVWQQICAAVRAFWRKVFNRNLAMSDNDIKYMFWLAAHNLNNPAEFTASEEVRNRLRKKTAQITKAPTAEQVAYDEDLARGIQKFTEAWVDSLNPLKKLQEVVAENHGELKSWENAYDIELGRASRTMARAQMMAERFLKPVLNAVSALMNNGFSQKEVTDYMIAKHGLERNDYYRREDLRELNEEIDTFIKDVATSEDYKELSEEEKIAVIRNEFKDYAKYLLDGGIKAALEWYGKNTDTYQGAVITDIEAIPLEDTAGLTGLMQSLDPKAEDFTKFAQNLVKEFEGKSITAVDVLWKAVRDLSNATLIYQVEGGIISREQYVHLRSMYRYYIPLRGWAEPNSRDFYEYSLSPSRYQEVVKAAEGRTSLADDPLANMANMLESAITIVEKNAAKQALARMAMNRPNSSLVKVVQLRYEKRRDKVTGRTVWEPIYPEIKENASAEDVDAAIEGYNEVTKQLVKDGEARTKRSQIDVGVRVLPGNKSDHYVTAKFGGEEVVVLVNGNPAAARALNGTNASKYEEDLQETIGRATRLYAKAHTTWAPRFALTNLIRDYGYGSLSAHIRHGGRYARRFQKNVRRAAWRLPKLLANGTSNLTAEQYDDFSQIDDQILRYFVEFLTNGGETGFSRSQSTEEWKKEIAKQLKELQGGDPRKVAQSVLGLLSSINRYAEDIPRFAAYLTSREMGKNVAESIKDAKEITVNFSRHGSGRYGNSAARNLFAFVNAGIQGFYNFASLAKENPRRFWPVIIGVFTSGFVIPFINGLLISAFGDDEDERNYKYLSCFNHTNRLVIFNPFGKEKGFITLPIAHELIPAYALGNIAHRRMGNIWWNADDPRDIDVPIAAELAGALLTAIPLDFVSAQAQGVNVRSAVPSVLQPLYDVYANEDFQGRPIYRSYNYGNGNTNRNDAAFTKAPIETWDWLVWVFRQISIATGGDGLVKPGWADFHISDESADIQFANPAIAQYLAESYLGGAVTEATRVGNLVKGAIARQRGDENAAEQYLASYNIPILSGLYRSSTERTADGRINEIYKHYRDDIAKQCEREFRAYMKELPEDVDKWAEYAKECLSSEEYKIYKLYQDADKVVRDAEKLLRFAQEKGTPKALMDSLREKIRVIKLAVIEEASDIRLRAGASQLKDNN